MQVIRNFVNYSELTIAHLESLKNDFDLICDGDKRNIIIQKKEQ